MGDTFEKRRREQKKRQKQKDKSVRKNERAADKARGDTPSFEVGTIEDIVGDLGRSDEPTGAGEPDAEPESGSR